MLVNIRCSNPHDLHFSINISKPNMDLFWSWRRPRNNRLSKLHHLVECNCLISIGIIDIKCFKEMRTVHADLWFDKFIISNPIRNVELTISIKIKSSMEELFECLLLDKRSTGYDTKNTYY